MAGVNTMLVIIACLAGGRYSNLGIHSVKPRSLLSTLPDTVTWLAIFMQTIRRTFSLWSSWCSLEALMMVSSPPGSPGELSPYQGMCSITGVLALAECRVSGQELINL